MPGLLNSVAKFVMQHIKIGSRWRWKDKNDANHFLIIISVEESRYDGTVVKYRYLPNSKISGIHWRPTKDWFNLAEPADKVKCQLCR